MGERMGLLEASRGQEHKVSVSTAKQGEGFHGADSYPGANGGRGGDSVCDLSNP